MLQITQNTLYPAIEQLEIQNMQHNDSQQPFQDQFIGGGRIRTNWNHYEKREFLDRLKRYIIPTKPANTLADQIVTQYFICSLNPIYEKISKLPHPIFVCGYCKQIFYGPSEYLLHCFQEQCPVNHNRSTYFFHFRNRFSQIRNADIPKTLDQTQLKNLKSISYRKKGLLLSSYSVKSLKQNSDAVIYCGKCGWEKKNVSINFYPNFLIHSILQCRSSKHPANSHTLTAVQYEQDSVEFVEDIFNWVINFNVITLFKDSYVRLDNNPKFSNPNSSKHFCANCKTNFSKVSDFIQHCLFECNKKPNAKSSHFFKRKMVMVPKDQVKQDQKVSIKVVEPVKQRKEQSLKNVKQHHSQNQEVFRQLNNSHEKIQEIKQTEEKVWSQKLNSQYQEIKDLFQNIYFCSECLTHFEDEKSYIAHIFVYLCPLNQPRNSHFFFQKESSQPLTIKTIEKFVRDTEILQNFYKTKECLKLQKIMIQNVRLIDKSTNQVLKTGKMADFHCGKCGQKFRKQYYFANHVIKCFSSNNPKNSHIVEFLKGQKMNDEEFKQFMLNYLYGVQIVRFNPSKRYNMAKNSEVDMELGYLCGKCDTQFENKYEYALHSILVCANHKHRNSSHFLTSTPIRSSEVIESPIDVIFSDIKQQKAVRKGPRTITYQSQQDTYKPQRMEIEDQRINVQRPIFNRFINVVVNSQQKEQEVKKQYKKIQKTEQSIVASRQRQEELSTNQMRFLRPNLNYLPNPKSSTFKLTILELYCGQCQISYKRQEDFIDHLKECRNFQNPISSHFYISNHRHEQSYTNNIFNNKNYRKVPMEFSFPEFKRDDNGTYICGCGDFGPLKKYIYHLKNAHNNNVPQGSSHVILRIVFYSYNNQLLNIPLEVKLRGVNPLHEFVCPCNSWKKYSYQQFVDHIMKRHEGKSPKFAMKLNN